MFSGRKKISTVYGLQGFLLSCILFTGCLTDSGSGDPVPPNIHGKWRVWYQDTVTTELVDIEKYFDYRPDSTYKYTRTTYGSSPVEMEQTGDWSIISNRIHMEIFSSYIDSGGGQVPFTPDTNVVELIFRVHGDTLDLTTFTTEFNEEGMLIFTPTTTYYYIKQ